MKIRLLFLLFLGMNITAIAQKKNIKERTMQEIEGYINYAYELLGKTDSAIIANGRPDSIIGCDKWDVEVINTNKKKNKLKASKAIVITTGCGALMLTVSEKSNLTYILTFLSMNLEGREIMSALQKKYNIDNSTEAVLQTRNSEFVVVSVMQGGILIMAVDKEKNKTQFRD